MYRFVSLFLLCALACACERTGKRPLPVPARQYVYSPVPFASLPRQQTLYVPVYSEIFYNASDQYYPLLTTLSVRNTSMTDSVFVGTVDFYDTEGTRLRQFIAKPVVLRPLQSVEFPLTYGNQGGAGANFILVWGSRRAVSRPVVQAVMIGSAYQQGFSWLTEGVPIDSVRRD